MDRFLNRLSGIFHVSPNKERLPDSVAENEKIARFIFSSKHYAKEVGRVKYAAYLPARNGESSVYRIDNISWEGVWKIGKEYVETGERKIRACAETSALEIRRNALKVTPETTVHYRHANIVSWPHEKDERKMLAMEIANKSQLGTVN